MCLGGRRFCFQCAGYKSISMDSLPFPAEELAWSKLKEVMDHCSLDKQSACSVLQLVLGSPSVPRSNFCS